MDQPRNEICSECSECVFAQAFPDLWTSRRAILSPGGRGARFCLPVDGGRALGPGRRDAEAPARTTRGIPRSPATEIFAAMIVKRTAGPRRSSECSLTVQGCRERSRLPKRGGHDRHCKAHGEADAAVSVRGCWERGWSLINHGDQIGAQSRLRSARRRRGWPRREASDARRGLRPRLGTPRPNLTAGKPAHRRERRHRLGLAAPRH